MSYPKISVVIGSYNRCNLLKLCIEAVRQELADESYEIIVVDGGSTDGAVEWLAAQKDIILILQHNRGEWNGEQIKRKSWAYFMNLAFKAASGKYVCMLSDDSLIISGAIVNGVDLFDGMLAQGVKVGAVAFYFRDYPIRKQYAVAVNVGNLYVNHGLFLKAALEEVGYCDESYHFYFADTDLALKIKEQGYLILDSKNSFVEHYFEATPDLRVTNNDKNKDKDRSRLIEKWKGKAFPSDQESNYRKRVGFWRHHPRQFVDQSRMIDKLIAASQSRSTKLPKISVVTIVKDDPTGLERTIKSVTVQSYPLIEYIVVNGGSDVETKGVIAKYASRIDTVINEPDDGIYDAMNKGIVRAQGEYLLFMNAGGLFYAQDVVEDFSSYLDGECDVVYGHSVYSSNDSKKVQKSHPVEYVERRMPFCHQSAFYRTNVLKRLPFNTTYKYSADYHQLVELYISGARFRQIDKVVCEYLAGGASESGLRPYLEVLKIQFDYFGGQSMKDSVYMKAFVKQIDSLLSAYR